MQSESYAFCFQKKLSAAPTILGTIVLDNMQCCSIFDKTVHHLSESESKSQNFLSL